MAIKNLAANYAKTEQNPDLEESQPDVFSDAVSSEVAEEPREPRRKRKRKRSKAVKDTSPSEEHSEAVDDGQTVRLASPRLRFLNDENDKSFSLEADGSSQTASPRRKTYDDGKTASPKPPALPKDRTRRTSREKPPDPTSPGEVGSTQPVLFSQKLYEDKQGTRPKSTEVKPRRPSKELSADTDHFSSAENAKNRKAEGTSPGGEDTDKSAAASARRGRSKSKKKK